MKINTVVRQLDKEDYYYLKSLGSLFRALRKERRGCLLDCQGRATSLKRPWQGYPLRCTGCDVEFAFTFTFFGPFREFCLAAYECDQLVLSMSF